jgi:hypothetical protein
LPKFHCELNPIEMVSWFLLIKWSILLIELSLLQYWGWCMLRGLVSLIKRVYFGGQKGEVYKSLSTLFIVLLKGR